MTTSRLEALKSLVEKNPKNPLARFGLANELYKLEKFEETVVEITAYLEIGNDEGAAYRILGDSYHKLGKTPEARSAYRRGIDVANSHGHPSMAEEYEEVLEFLD